MKNAFLSLFNYLSMLLVTVILKYYKKVVKNDISPVCMLSYSHFINMSVNHSIVSVQRIKCHFSTAIFRCITYITVAFNKANKDGNKNIPDLAQKSLEIWPG